MRFLFLAILYLSLSCFSPVMAQREIEYKEYPDLLMLYMDEKYEKIIKKCEGGGLFPGITEKERRQPLPYIYLSKAYYEISKLEEYKEEYSRAFKQALKYASRFVDRDEKKKFIDDHERYLSQLRKETIEIAKVHYEKGQHEKREYRKARYYYKKIADFSPNDPSPHFMEGLTWIKQELARQADRPFQTAMQKLKELESADQLEPEQNKLFKFFLKEYSNYLVKEGERDSAIRTLEYAEPIYDGDPEFEKQLKGIK